MNRVKISGDELKKNSEIFRTIQLNQALAEVGHLQERAKVANQDSFGESFFFRAEVTRAAKSEFFNDESEVFVLGVFSKGQTKSSPDLYRCIQIFSIATCINRITNIIHLQFQSYFGELQQVSWDI